MRVFTLAALLTTAPLAAAPLTGTWTNPANSVRVDMRPCGRSTCGVVVWANDRALADAEAGGTDRLVGSELFTDLRADGPGHWSGAVFVPDLGRTVEGTLTLLDARTLEVEGCLVAGFACKAQVWTRVAQSRR